MRDTFAPLVSRYFNKQKNNNNSNSKPNLVNPASQLPPIDTFFSEHLRPSYAEEREQMFNLVLGMNKVQPLVDTIYDPVTPEWCEHSHKLLVETVMNGVKQPLNGASGARLHESLRYRWFDLEIASTRGVCIDRYHFTESCAVPIWKPSNDALYITERNDANRNIPALLLRRILRAELVQSPPNYFPYSRLLSNQNPNEKEAAARVLCASSSPQLLYHRPLIVDQYLALCRFEEARDTTTTVERPDDYDDNYLSDLNAVLSSFTETLAYLFNETERSLGWPRLDRVLSCPRIFSRWFIPPPSQDARLMEALRQRKWSVIERDYQLYATVLWRIVRLHVLHEALKIVANGADRTDVFHTPYSYSAVKCIEARARLMILTHLHISAWAQGDQVWSDADWLVGPGGAEIVKKWRADNKLEDSTEPTLILPPCIDVGGHSPIVIYYPHCRNLPPCELEAPDILPAIALSNMTRDVNLKPSSPTLPQAFLHEVCKWALNRCLGRNLVEITLRYLHGREPKDGKPPFLGYPSIKEFLLIVLRIGLLGTTRFATAYPNFAQCIEIEYAFMDIVVPHKNGTHTPVPPVPLNTPAAGAATVWGAKDPVFALPVEIEDDGVGEHPTRIAYRRIVNWNQSDSVSQFIITHPLLCFIIFKEFYVTSFSSCQPLDIVMSRYGQWGRYKNLVTMRMDFVRAFMRDEGGFDMAVANEDWQDPLNASNERIQRHHKLMLALNPILEKFKRAEKKCFIKLYKSHMWARVAVKHMNSAITLQQTGYLPSGYKRIGMPGDDDPILFAKNNYTLTSTADLLSPERIKRGEELKSAKGKRCLSGGCGVRNPRYRFGHQVASRSAGNGGSSTGRSTRAKRSGGGGKGSDDDDDDEDDEEEEDDEDDEEEEEEEEEEEDEAEGDMMDIDTAPHPDSASGSAVNLSPNAELYPGEDAEDEEAAALIMAMIQNEMKQLFADHVVDGPTVVPPKVAALVERDSRLNGKINIISSDRLGNTTTSTATPPSLSGGSGGGGGARIVNVSTVNDNYATDYTMAALAKQLRAAIRQVNDVDFDLMDMVTRDVMRRHQSTGFIETRWLVELFGVSMEIYRRFTSVYAYYESYDMPDHQLLERSFNILERSPRDFYVIRLYLYMMLWHSQQLFIPLSLETRHRQLYALRKRWAIPDYQDMPQDIGWFYFAPGSRRWFSAEAGAPKQKIDTARDRERYLRDMGVDSGKAADLVRLKKAQIAMRHIEKESERAYSVNMEHASYNDETGLLYARRKTDPNLRRLQAVANLVQRPLGAQHGRNNSDVIGTRSTGGSDFASQLDMFEIDVIMAEASDAVAAVVGHTNGGANGTSSSASAAATSAKPTINSKARKGRKSSTMPADPMDIDGHNALNDDDDDDDDDDSERAKSVRVHTEDLEKRLLSSDTAPNAKRLITTQDITLVVTNDAKGVRRQIGWISEETRESYRHSASAIQSLYDSGFRSPLVPIDMVGRLVIMNEKAYALCTICGIPTTFENGKTSNSGHVCGLHDPNGLFKNNRRFIMTSSQALPEKPTESMRKLILGQSTAPQSISTAVAAAAAAAAANPLGAKPTKLKRMGLQLHMPMHLEEQSSSNLPSNANVSTCTFCAIMGDCQSRLGIARSPSRNQSSVEYSFWSEEDAAMIKVRLCDQDRRFAQPIIDLGYDASYDNVIQAIVEGRAQHQTLRR